MKPPRKGEGHVFLDAFQRTHVARTQRLEPIDDRLRQFFRCRRARGQTHATLAGHSMEHELEYAGSQGYLGSMDANTGDLLLGWDTDQFPTDIYLTTKCMLAVMKHGGLAPGGVNFDAKVRRESHEPVDLFHAHIGGMDAFARGLKIAAAIRADGRLGNFVKERYGSWDTSIGKEIESGDASFKTLDAYMLEKGDVTPNASGRQEFLENLINEFI